MFGGSIVIVFGVLVIDWLSNGNQITSWLSTAFAKIHENPNLQSWLLPIIGWVSVMVGATMLVYAGIQMSVSVMRFPGHSTHQKQEHQVHKSRCLCGGIRHLSGFAGIKVNNMEVTAVVTVADSGGSTGKLREELLIIAPGDIRRCMLALSDQPLLDKIIALPLLQGFRIT